jgi:hypothetical protein
MPEGVMNANLHWYNQTTLYDRLNEKERSWKIYFGDIAQSWVLVNQWAPRNMINYHHMQRFFEDAAGPEPKFPSYVFIEPTYNPPGANDDHPCHNVLDGERLIAEVYAIRANEELWRSSLLVVLYDEHGGYYDHVSPPPAVPPDHHQEEFAFNRLGVRSRDTGFPLRQKTGGEYPIRSHEPAALRRREMGIKIAGRSSSRREHPQHRSRSHRHCAKRYANGVADAEARREYRGSIATYGAIQSSVGAVCIEPFSGVHD